MSLTHRLTLFPCRSHLVPSSACCYDENCYVWQQGDKHCFHGDKHASCSSSAAAGGDPMVGGMRETTAAPKTDYAFAKADTDDRTWEAVDVPHDFVG